MTEDPTTRKCNKECQKKNRFYKQNNNFARASHLFVHFFARFFTITIKKCLIYRFMEYVNKQWRNFILCLNLDMVPRNSTAEGFAYIWKSKWVEIIVIKTERTKIHYLSDVVVAVASLDLKVPIYSGALAREARQRSTMGKKMK